MADNDKDQHKVNALKAWKYTLNKDRAAALESARQAARRLADAKLFHPDEVRKYYNQMLNGSATPNDFQPGEYGRITVA